mgnify:CR=1 FL=1
MPKAYFVVRATVADTAKRKAFDAWYAKEHLPDAVKVFGVRKAWRFWSVSNPALHEAMYEFANQAALDRGAPLSKIACVHLPTAPRPSQGCTPGRPPAEPPSTVSSLRSPPNAPMCSRTHLSPHS